MVSSTVLDLGKVEPGQELVSAVKLINSGDDILHIAKVDPGCACAEVRLEEKVILPRHASLLHVRARFSEKTESLQFRVRIYSNDPANPESVFLVRGEQSAPILLADPMRLDFGPVVFGDQPKRTIRLSKRDGMPWASQGPSIEFHCGEGTPFQIVSSNSSKTSLTLHMQLRHGILPGAYEDTLIVQETGLKWPLRVPVTGQIVQRISVSPSTLYFEDVSASSGLLTRSLIVQRADGKHLSNFLRASGVPGVKVSEARTARSAPHTKTQLAVTLDPGTANEDIKDGKLFLWFEDEHNPVVVRVIVLLAEDTRTKRL
jgi:hypothetical protein